MPVVRRIAAATLWCALGLTGCPKQGGDCPEATVNAETREIPEGSSETRLTVDVFEPNPGSGFEVITELTSVGGRINDPFARDTTFGCASDQAGEVEICVTASYASDEESAFEAVGAPTQSRPSDVTASHGYLRPAHVRLIDPLSCSETRCTTVICPSDQNICPEILDFGAEPPTLDTGQSATIRVEAQDPDANPEPLTTTLNASNGRIADRNADETTYTCDPIIGGVNEICVVASDGDPACDATRCTGVRCPGEPPENSCPIIEAFTADPLTVPKGESTTEVRVDVFDPDEFPQPLRTELSSSTGVFEDRFVTETTFTCGSPGRVEMCVEASDGDPACDRSRCISVRCPAEIPVNFCPQLFVLNAVPSTVPPGQRTTLVQSRGQDLPRSKPDGPMPLELTMRALWGTITNDENIPGAEDPTVTEQNATYTCDRPGPAEICVDATDGACLKTICIVVDCPDDIAAP